LSPTVSIAGCKPVLAHAALAVMLALAGPTLANPVGPTVTSGQASFQTQGKALTVTNAPGTIIHWQGFSIRADELTRFIQQSSLSAVLNRVTGGQPSEILGRLSSNGRVFLINPSGIAFGAGAQIDVGGLVASSLNISDADFLAGRLRFSGNGSEGGVSNRGEITTPVGGSVALVAPQVENSGVVRAPSGDIVLAAGSTVRLVDSAFPAIQVEVSAPGDTALNLGTLNHSGRVFAFLVRQSGVLSASAAGTGDGGRVALRSAGQTVVSAGAKVQANAGATGRGGEIVLAAADFVHLAGAIEARGGEAYGNGGRVSLRSANDALVGAMALVDVSAPLQGHGGEVALIADDVMHFSAAIEARGGALSGDGGRVEVSGLRTLVFTGSVDTRAPQGRDGALLLDPTIIRVVAGSSGTPASLGDALWGAAEDSGTQTLGVLDLAALLGTTSVTLQATQRIEIAAPLVVAAANPRTLTLQAPDISVQAPVTSTGAALELRLEATGGRIDIAEGLELALGGGRMSVLAQQVRVAPAELPRVPEAMARSVSPPAGLADLRAAVQAEIERDNARLAAAMKPCGSAGASVKAGCTVATPPRRFTFAG
jgi:filamentous hemagglutinin family protein